MFGDHRLGALRAEKKVEFAELDPRLERVVVGKHVQEPGQPPGKALRRPDAQHFTLGPGRHVALTVTDSGIGIPPENIEKIFEPFFTTKESGTGMGLAAVRGTVLEHQGSISVKSEPGMGTTFRLLLPLSEMSPTEQIAPLAPAKSPAGGKVLVVDDEVTVASVVGRTLTKGGYDVELCHSGQGALDRYRTDTFDLVLLDVMMPDLDGVEVLRRIRAKVPTAKVMLMTGHASESVETRLREFSDVVVLSKPFQPKQLIEEVRKVIAR